MNLVVDFGNTRVKTALFKGADMLSHKTYNNVSELIKDKSFYEAAQNIIICTVTAHHTEFINSLQNGPHIFLYEASMPIPLKNLYNSVSTLGSDRIAASVGSFCFYPGENVLTIDAGTCIKYNFVNAKNEFIGGAISPGLNMRLKAMNHYTGRLPLVPIDLNYEKLTGTNTNESILSGALIGAVAEVDSMITRYMETHKNLRVVMAGGDSDYLCKQLKNRFFAHPYIVLYGLNKILNFNLEK